MLLPQYRFRTRNCTPLHRCTVWILTSLRIARMDSGVSMDILIKAAHGDGPTELSAFDRALWFADIANYNLLPLSSVIPPGARIVHPATCMPGGQWGDRLYVVLAEHRQSQPGKTACAGIGWVRDRSTGAGLFVEHHADTKAAVESLIEQSLNSMTSYRPEEFGPIQTCTADIECIDRPVCALVAAIYAVEPWNTVAVPR